jgi:glycosyltransferase involved in cell wall biosynthesis
VATAAPWLASYVREHGTLSARVESIPNGIDIEGIAQRSPRGRIERIVSFGRFSAHKGIPEIVEAAVELRARGARFHLTLIGGGPFERQVREAVARHDLASSVTIEPTVPREELLSRMKDFDLFVLASHSEGLPIALLEAMAARLPAVVAARPYATSLVGESDVRFFDPDRPEALADALAADLGDPESAESRAARARRTVEAFSWDRAAERELDLLLGTTSD